MIEILNKIPLTLLLPILIVLLIVLTVLVIKAFKEGRSFKVWGIEIGQRPDRVKIDSNTTGALTTSTSETKPTGEPVENYQTTHRHSLSETNVSELDVFSAESIEVIIKTDHSVIEKRRIDGKNHVVKRTDSKVCQLEALEHLVGKKFTGYDGGVTATFATPLKVWLDDKYVWELHPHYDGISLLELIKKNQYLIQGDLLGRIFNVLIQATSQIHKEGILHRDLNPSNIFITDSQLSPGLLPLLILDCSFCCRMNSTQIPVSTSNYTAPEQIQGLATYQSDWYSIAATLFFLANGFSPERALQERFKNGLLNLNPGSLRAPFNFNPRTEGLLGIQKSVPKLIETLLEPDPLNRPQKEWEILLDESSKVTEFYEVIGILDMGRLGWLVIQEYDFQVLSNDKIRDFLNEAFSHKAINAPSISADAQRILES